MTIFDIIITSIGVFCSALALRTGSHASTKSDDFLKPAIFAALCATAAFTFMFVFSLTPTNDASPKAIQTPEISTVLATIALVIALLGNLVWHAARDAIKEMKEQIEKIGALRSEIEKQFEKYSSHISSLARKSQITSINFQARTELISSMISDDDESLEYRARAELLGIFNDFDEDTIALYLDAFASNPAFYHVISNVIWQAISTFPELYPGNEKIAAAVKALKKALGR